MVFQRSKDYMLFSTLRVKAKYDLGKVYFDAGKNEQAKEAFEYVIQNGNTLYYVREAKEYLSKINSYKMG